VPANVLVEEFHFMSGAVSHAPCAQREYASINWNFGRARPCGSRSRQSKLFAKIVSPAPINTQLENSDVISAGITAVVEKARASAVR